MVVNGPEGTDLERCNVDVTMGGELVVIVEAIGECFLKSEKEAASCAFSFDSPSVFSTIPPALFTASWMWGIVVDLSSDGIISELLSLGDENKRPSVLFPLPLPSSAPRELESSLPMGGPSLNGSSSEMISNGVRERCTRSEEGDSGDDVAGVGASTCKSNRPLTNGC